MFDIEYKGGNTVVLSTKKSTLIVDPKSSVVGLKDQKVQDAIVVATEERFQVQDESVLLSIEGPGEYEVSDFSIRGIPAMRHIDAGSDEHLSTIYRIEVGDIRLVVVGNVADKLTDEQLEEIGVVDIAIVPVGGSGYTLDATAASAMVRQIDPKAVVPVHYADSALAYEVPQDTLDTFVKELGAPVETVSKYKIKGASSLPQVLTTIEVTRA